MKYKSLVPLFLLILSGNTVFCQSAPNEQWTENERAYYQNANALARYVYGKKPSEISRDTLFARYISFDYVLNDAVAERRAQRMEAFDTLFYYFRNTIDSLGIENLDAKPVRFFKGHAGFESFEKELAEAAPHVLAYYEKRAPGQPGGYLLFDPESKKLLAWIVINQGGRKYFLTFNLL